VRQRLLEQASVGEAVAKPPLEGVGSGQTASRLSSRP
jgi:hypothetical protein